MTTSVVIFITGVGRGIGNGLARSYLARPNHIVIGSVRDVQSPKYDQLKASPLAEGSRLLLVPLESASLDDPAEAIKQVEAAGITHIDVVIANAGMVPTPGPFDNTPVKDVVDAFSVNAASPMALYQAARPLLEKSAKPIWLSISSAVGSVGNLESFQFHYLLAYGVSKAALNWFTVGIHAAHPEIIAYAIHPGLVQTDMGNAGARGVGLEKAPVTLIDSCNKITESIDNATREKTSGRFLDLIQGIELPW